MIRRMATVIFFLNKGVYNYANGNKYDGEWNDNLRDGKGKFLQKSQDY